MEKHFNDCPVRLKACHLRSHGSVELFFPGPLCKAISNLFHDSEERFRKRMFATAYAVFIFLRIILKGNTGRAAWDYGSGCSSMDSVRKNSSVTWDKSNCQRVQSRKLCLPTGRQGILKRGAKARRSLGLSEVQQLSTREQKWRWKKEEGHLVNKSLFGVTDGWVTCSVWSGHI